MMLRRERASLPSTVRLQCFAIRPRFAANWASIMGKFEGIFVDLV
ncbi:MULTISPECIES: hypothetical protein [Photorhabdus]